MLALNDHVIHVNFRFNVANYLQCLEISLATCDVANNLQRCFRCVNVPLGPLHIDV